MADRVDPHRRFWRQACSAAVLAALAASLAATVVWKPRPRLVWNVSASAPLGLYVIGGPDGARAGDTVLARVPAPWREIAGARRYIPVNVPLVKRVAAGRGDSVCGLGRRIFINGEVATWRFARDHKGRLLPSWTGCITLGKGELFLLMDNPSSFDGRYFGPTRADDVIGKAKLTWPG